jgi:hypothetical protein
VPCDSTPRRVPDPKTGKDRPQTKKERLSETITALARLEAALAAGTVKAVIGKTGGIAFVGAWDRRGISDACAYRNLKQKGSSALRMAEARAEATAGRQVDQQAVRSGLHSHDGGKTWGKD